jgi:plastocyanin
MGGEVMKAAWIAVVCLAAATQAAAGELNALVRDASGQPLADAVVVAVPAGAPIQLPGKRRTEVIEQAKSEFLPFVSTILVGAHVAFPNRDNWRHHVYSFSPTKRFELPLYAGTPSNPILFDVPGVVVLGCNVHDWMIGYVYVSESPYFAKTGVDGRAQLVDLPARTYTVRVWHPRLQGDEKATRRSVVLGAQGASTQSWDLLLGPEVRRPRPAAGGPAKS